MIGGIVAAVIVLIAVAALYAYRRRRSSLGLRLRSSIRSGSKQSSGSNEVRGQTKIANPAYANEHDGTGGDVELPTMPATARASDTGQQHAVPTSRGRAGNTVRS